MIQITTLVYEHYISRIMHIIYALLCLCVIYLQVNFTVTLLALQQLCNYLSMHDKTSENMGNILHGSTRNLITTKQKQKTYITIVKHMCYAVNRSGYTSNAGHFRTGIDNLDYSANTRVPCFHCLAGIRSISVYYRETVCQKKRSIAYDLWNDNDNSWSFSPQKAKKTPSSLR